MQNPLINGGLSNFIALPTFGSVGIEVAIRLDTAWVFPAEPSNTIFAIGVSTAGTDPVLSPDGPGITITNDGYIIGMDNGNLNHESNRVDTGSPMPSDSYTVLRFEWSLTGVKLFRDGVEFFLPTPLDGMGDLISDAWATFAFQAGGGGLPVCFLEYVDINGTTQNLTPPFWTAFLGTHEVGEAGVTPPDPGGEPTVFTEIALPYSAAVPTGANFHWYKVTVDTASTQRFTTLNSPNASADPYLALYSSTGAVLASNEDWDLGSQNFLAQFDYAVTPGIYWLAIATFEGGSSGNWGLVSGGALSPGLQLDISEAP